MYWELLKSLYWEDWNKKTEEYVPMLSLSGKQLASSVLLAFSLRNLNLCNSFHSRHNHTGHLNTFAIRCLKLCHIASRKYVFSSCHTCNLDFQPVFFFPWTHPLTSFSWPWVHSGWLIIFPRPPCTATQVLHCTIPGNHYLLQNKILLSHILKSKMCLKLKLARRMWYIIHM